MTQSVELLLDEPTDRGVRADWQLLIDAGLPSAGRHLGASNRPHVTLLAASAIGDEPGVAAAAATGLPEPVTLGGLVLFGRGEFVLARLVVPSAALLARQAAVVAAAGAEPFPHLQPGDWTPHVTLARRMRPGQVAAALDLLDGVHPVAGRAVAARRWDSEAKRQWTL